MICIWIVQICLLFVDTFFSCKMDDNQIKWGGLLIRLLRKHRKSLLLDVQWRPLYDTLIKTHFKR
jgi:hypothetical protein